MQPQETQAKGRVQQFLAGVEAVFARGFTSGGQLMARLFCQLGRTHSLREIGGGLAGGEGQWKPLGVPVAPQKSTLAYAQEQRPWELYQTVFEQTLLQCQERVSRQGGRKKFRFQNKLMSLEGSIKGRDPTAPAAGPRWLPAVVRGGDRGQDQREQGGAHAAVGSGHDPGDRPRLQR